MGESIAGGRLGVGVTVVTSLTENKNRVNRGKLNANSLKST